MSEPSIKWAVVTGASSGLGREFALAARSWNVVLAALRVEPMQMLARNSLSSTAHMSRLKGSILASRQARPICRSGGDAHDINPDILINSAGFGLSGGFLAQEPARLMEMLQLDIVSLTELTHLFDKRMPTAERDTFCWWRAWLRINPTVCSLPTGRQSTTSSRSALHCMSNPLEK